MMTKATDDAYVILAGNTLTAGSAHSLLSNDEAASPPEIDFVIAGRGVIHTNTDGTFIYFPQGLTGIDHLEYTFFDPLDGSPETAKVSIYVVPVNVGPTSTTLNLVGLTADEQIAATYVAFFGRAADAGGHDFWVNEFNVGKATQSPSTLFSNIASSFGISNEAKSLYPFLVNPINATDDAIHTFLNNVYDNLFNRQSDAAGLAYWTAQTKAALQAGKFVGSVLVDIMSGAQDTAAGKDITTLMSKVAVSLHYVEAQKELHTAWTPADDLAEAKALLDGVTNEASTVLVGIAQADRLVEADVL
jgi:hypothetical protein